MTETAEAIMNSIIFKISGKPKALIRHRDRKGGSTIWDSLQEKPGFGLIPGTMRVKTGGDSSAGATRLM